MQVRKMENEVKDKGKVYMLEEVADMWNISVRAVKEMVASGELKAFLVKKRLRISQAMLDEYIMSHTVDKK